MSYLRTGLLLSHLVRAHHKQIRVHLGLLPLHKLQLVSFEDILSLSMHPFDIVLCSSEHLIGECLEFCYRLNNFRGGLWISNNLLEIGK